MDKNEKDILVKTLEDMIARSKALDRIDASMKVLSSTYKKINFKTCDANKLSDLADAFDGVCSVLAEIIKENEQ